MYSPLGSEIRVFGADEFLDAIRDDHSISLPERSVLKMNTVLVCGLLALRVRGIIFMNIVGYPQEHPSMVAARAWGGLPPQMCCEGHGLSKNSSEK